MKTTTVTCDQCHEPLFPYETCAFDAAGLVSVLFVVKAAEMPDLCRSCFGAKVMEGVTHLGFFERDAASQADRPGHDQALEQRQQAAELAPQPEEAQ